jgi:ATP synthase I chain
MSAGEAASPSPIQRVIDLRRPLIMSAAMGVLGLVASGLLGHILMGILGVGGLLLGLLNTRLIQRSVSRATAVENPNKKALAVSALGRLAIITAIAIAVGVLLKPDGIGIFLGLAVFQLIMIASTSASAVKGLRQQ